MDYLEHTLKVGLSTRRPIFNGILSFSAKKIISYHSKSLLFCERSVPMQVKEAEKLALVHET